MSGALEGQQSIEEGFNSQDVPIFVQAGLDTTVSQVSALDDPATADVDESATADTTQVPVYKYAISRGTCDQFSDAGADGAAGADAAAISGIRNNYGLDCNGVRLPATAKTLYTASGKLNYTYGTGSRVSISLATSRNQGHRFPLIIRYLNNLALPTSMQGFAGRNWVSTFNWTQNLSKSTERALALDVALSYQLDRNTTGPLQPESALSTLDPFGGFIIKPLHFLFDQNNFPITDELIKNVR